MDGPEIKNFKFFNQSNFTAEKRKFLFFLPGYNLQSSEINAAAGLIQLKKLKKFIKVRWQNYNIIKKTFDRLDKIKLQKQIDYSSWFGFGIIFNTSKIKFKKIINILNKNKIDTRPIVTRDFTKQPVMKYYFLIKKIRS